MHRPQDEPDRCLSQTRRVHLSLFRALGSQTAVTTADLALFLSVVRHQLAQHLTALTKVLSTQGTASESYVRGELVPPATLAQIQRRQSVQR